MPEQHATPARELRPDCARCAALCCVALPLTRSADFAIDKAAGTPCPNLATDLGCGIHAQLRERGFPGCVAFDCFGAGQHVTQVTFGGVGRQDWRNGTAVAQAMFDAFAVMRQLHEMLWYLAQARRLGAELAVVTALSSELGDLTDADADALVATDLPALRGRVGAVLGAISATLRGAAARPLRGADLAGRDLRAEPLAGADLRGALLIGCDLRGVDLHRTDLLGADLRGARLDGALLADTLFLTSPQVASARGDATTSLPEDIERPQHWR